MLSNNAQHYARAFLPITSFQRNGHKPAMRDWAIDYILHVLEAKDWSANRLATEAKVASSTIARPLRERDTYTGKLSRTTIAKIHEASGIDPAPFIPDGMHEDSALFGKRPQTNADRVLSGLDIEPPAQIKRNEIKIAINGPLAQIVATVDREGIASLRRKLDAIETMLDD